MQWRRGDRVGQIEKERERQREKLIEASHNPAAL